MPKHIITAAGARRPLVLSHDLVLMIVADGLRVVAGHISSPIPVDAKIVGITPGDVLGKWPKSYFTLWIEHPSFIDTEELEVRFVYDKEPVTIAPVVPTADITPEPAT